MVHGTKIKKPSDLCCYGVNSSRHTNMKGCCELCSCTASVNAFKIGLDGTVEGALRQK